VKKSDPTLNSSLFTLHHRFTPHEGVAKTGIRISIPLFETAKAEKMEFLGIP
jgi:hypothetical protein